MRAGRLLRGKAGIAAACFATALSFLLWSSPGAASSLFELDAPHRVTKPHAWLAPRLVAQLSKRRHAKNPKSVPALIRFSLVETALRLHFGLRHRTSLRFDTAEREGNCIEYSELFATIFNYAARAAGVRATAFEVHSEHARLLGLRIPLRGWNHHDWVLVVVRDRHGHVIAKQFVDPTFYDAGFGWNIRDSVHGKLNVPAKPKKR